MMEIEYQKMIRRFNNAVRKKIENLDPQYYLAQTQSIEDKQEIVSQKARELFVENILSFIPDGHPALAALGKNSRKKLEKGTKMYDIVYNQPGAVEMYTELSIPFPVRLITSQDPKDVAALRAYEKVIVFLKKEADEMIEKISSKHENTAAIQMGLLFSEAFAFHFPDMIPYYTIGKNKGFPAKLAAYILKNQDTVFSSVNPDNFDLKFNALKTQLQFIEPSLKTFDQILMCFAGYCIHSVLYKKLGDGFAKDKLTSEQEERIDAILKGTLRLIDELAKTDVKIAEFRKTLADAIPIPTNTAGLAFPFFDLMKNLMVPPNPEFDTNILGRMDKELENYNIAKTKKALDKAKTNCNVLFRMIQGGLLVACTYENFSSEDALKATGTFFKEFSLFAGDAVSSFKAGNKFLTNAIFGALTKTFGRTLFTSFPTIKKSLGVVLGKTVGEFFTNRVAPILLLVDAINTYNSLDSQNDEQVAYVLKFSTFVVQTMGGLGGLVTALLGATAISAYICGMASFIVVIIAMCLSLRLSIDQTIDIKIYFLSIKLDANWDVSNPSGSVDW